MTEARRIGFYDKPVKGLSIAVLVLGCLCVGLGAAVLVIALTERCIHRDYNYYGGRHDSYNRYDYYQTTTTTTTTTPRTWTTMCYYDRTWVSPGIWSGLLFVASGIIGMLSAKKKTTCFIVSMMVMSIVTAWISAAGVLFAISANFDNRWDDLNPYPIKLIILNSVTALFCLVCFVLSLIKFGYACRAVCCNGSSGLPAVKKSGHQYHSLQTQPMFFAPMTQQPMTAQSNVPVTQPLADSQAMPVLQQTAAQPIYLVQGHQVIGMLPANMQQQPPVPAPVINNPVLAEVSSNQQV